MSKNTWTDAEVDQLARALMQRYPSRRFESATRPHQVNINDLELTPVLQATLAADRLGLRPKISRVKRDLLEAFQRVTGKAAATPDEVSPQDAAGTSPEGSDGATKQRKVRWTGDEWRFCALALHTLCPALDLVNAKDASGVTLRELNQAASMMEPGRQRVFKSLSEPMAHLMEVYARARRERDPFYFGQGKEPATITRQLAQPVTPVGRAGDPKIFWTAEEYLSLGRHLQAQYPHAMEGDLPGLTSGELARAVQAVLPPERRRRMANQAHVTSFVRRLRDALIGKPIWTAEQFETGGLVPSDEEFVKHDFRSGPRIKWCAEEWDALVRKLHELDPQLEHKPDYLTLALLNEASSMMARPRRFFNVNSPRRLLDEARARISMGEPEPVVAEQPDPAPIPEPQQEAPPAAMADKLFAKVEWTREEWLAVARELHRLFPLANYPARTSLTGLDSQDVAFAQERALPFERRRRHLKVASFSSLKAPLERAFADLAIELEKGVQPPKAQDTKPAPTPAPTAAPTAPPTTPPPEPAPVIVAPAPAATAPAQSVQAAEAVDPYRTAFAPIVGLVATEVANQLFPMLTQFINQAVTIALQAQLQAPANDPAQPADEAKPTPAPAPAAPVTLTCVPKSPEKNYGDEKPRTEKPKKLVVGVLVNRTSQYQAELEREFPQIEVRCIDADHKASIERASMFDVLFGMERFVNHPITKRAKNILHDRYVPCNGAMSELKRSIGIWLRTRAGNQPVQKQA